MIGRMIGETIQVNIDLDSKLYKIKADEGCMDQIIMNLIVNSKDAMPEGGELNIKTKNVEIKKEHCKYVPDAREGTFVQLCVEDNGNGMDEDILTHIFDPFFTTKETGKGTGLGLSVVHGIVKQHQGWIDVFSEPGRGTHFHIYIPAIFTAKQNNYKNKIKPSSLSGDGERILLVEDDKDVRGFLKTFLSDNGYKIFDAANANDALTLFKKENGDFHLIFTDMALPDHNGVVLIEKLIKLKPDLDVIICSGYYDDQIDRDELRKKGFRFIQKPLDCQHVLREIKITLNLKKGG
jgi:CheY-like chemotaxis protein